MWSSDGSVHKRGEGVAGHGELCLCYALIIKKYRLRGYYLKKGHLKSTTP